MVNKYRKVGNYINKVLFTAVLTLILLILLKSNNDFKTDFYKQVYDTNISFSKNLSVYKKYFGSLIPEDNTKAVFQENLDYTDRTSYLEGVSLSVGNGYLVPAIDSGLVINIGEKEGYGNCLVVQQINEIDLMYCNMDKINVSMYDYVSEGDLLGEVNDKLYLVYKKDGNVLNYEEYLQ